MEYSSPKLISSLTVPALILVIIALGYFVLFPSFQDLQAKQDMLESEQQKLTQTQAAVDGVKELVADLQSKRMELASIDETIPTSPDIPELLANFDYLATQSGITIISLQLKPAKTIETAQSGSATAELLRLQQLLSATKGLGVMDIDLTMAGSYENLKAFLLNLEQNLRLMDIQNIVITEPDLESGLQEFTMTIQTYYQQGQ